MKTAIIGTGLIGGSFAMSMQSRGLGGEIWGVDASAEHLKTALERGIIDRAATLDEALETCDLLVVATPVDTVPGLAVRILNRIGAHQTAMDVGSVKAELCEMISRHPMRGRFVASHPMWGTENSGPESAVETGFTGRTAVICEPERSDDDARGTVAGIYEAIGMKIKTMEAEEHDVHAAYISHISHISSFALALTVLEKEREEDTIFDLAAGGFDSTVRLAKSSPRMWLPIFMKNKYNVLDPLRELIHQLRIMQRMIERDDEEGLRAAMEKANTIKRILK